MCAEPPAFRRRSLPAHILLGLIGLYRMTLSAVIGRQCRYLPTCSAYTADAVRAHGAWVGSWMGLARICRCRPGGGSGWDPAPLSPGPFDGAVVPWWQPWRYGDWRGGVRAVPDSSDSPKA